jgi:8-oxo-dGTP diphosphatase
MRILITERLEEGPFQGLWEFPGGKIAANESPEAALARELSEEIGILSPDSVHFMSLQHDYSDRQVSIDFYRVEAWQKEPVGCEGQRIRWVSIDELATVDLLPADAPVVEALMAEREQNQQMLS